MLQLINITINNIFLFFRITTICMGYNPYRFALIMLLYFGVLVFCLLVGREIGALMGLYQETTLFSECNGRLIYELIYDFIGLGFF